MQRLLIFLLFTGLLSNSGICQNELFSWDYYSYLKKNDLLREALTWLDNYPESTAGNGMSNKIVMEKAQIHLLLGSLDSSHYYYGKCDLENDSSEIIKALYLSFILKDTASVSRYIGKYRFLLNYEDVRISYEIIKDGTAISDTLACKDEYFGPIVADLKNYKKRSPFVSAMLSAVVPGLGKLYAGMSYQARSSFFINTALGLVLAEALLVPAGSIYIGFCIAVSSVFYIGNIWGSSALVLKRETDFYNQIDEDISDYYNLKLLP